MLRIDKFVLSAAAAAGITLGLAPISAQADILWTVPTLSFTDGGTLSGTFVTTEAGALESWDLTTTPGTSPVTGFTYDSSTDPGADIVRDASDSTVQVGSNDETIGYLSLYFLNTLTLANSPDPLEGGTEQFDGTRYLDLTDGASISGQEISASDPTPPADQTPVPEPMSIAVLGTALSGLAITRRARRT